MERVPEYMLCFSSLFFRSENCFRSFTVKKNILIFKVAVVPLDVQAYWSMLCKNSDSGSKIFELRRHFSYMFICIALKTSIQPRRTVLLCMTSFFYLFSRANLLTTHTLQLGYTET